MFYCYIRYGAYGLNYSPNLAQKMFVASGQPKLKEATISATLLSANTPLTAVPSVHGCLQGLRRGYASRRTCTGEVQGTSSTYCLYLAQHAVC